MPLISKGGGPLSLYSNKEAPAAAEIDSETMGTQAAGDSAGEDNMRSKAIAELLSTERTFVSEMTALTQVFLFPLRGWCVDLMQECIQQEEDGLGRPFPELCTADLVCIFSNLELLLEFNKRFLADLEAAAASPEGPAAVVEVFLKAAPFFKMFSVYVNNFDKAREGLTLVRARIRTHAFLRACEMQPACRGLGLNDFLIQPIQRIPRYRLLLDTVLKYTAAGDALLPRLQQALDLISSVADKINCDLHAKAAQDKMLQLQAEFGTLDFLEPSRHFIMEGDLTKVSRNGPRDHKFVLFNDKLVYGEEKNFVRGMFGARKQYRKNHDFPLERGLYIVNDVGGSYSGGSILGNTGFIVITPEKSFIVHADSPSEKDAWVQAFRTVMGELAAKGDSRTSQQHNEMDLSDKVKPAKSGKAIAPELSVWVANKEGKLMRQAFSLPPSALSASCGVLSYSELSLKNSIDVPAYAGLSLEDDFQYPAWGGKGHLAQMPSPKDRGAAAAGIDVSVDHGAELNEPGTKLDFDVILQPGAAKLGLRLRDMQGGGVLVIGFSTQSSIAELSGVRLGDRITHINNGPTLTSGQQITETVAACSAAAQCGTVLVRLTVRRGFAPLAVSVPVSSLTSEELAQCGTPIAQAVTEDYASVMTVVTSSGDVRKAQELDGGASPVYAHEVVAMNRPQSSPHVDSSADSSNAPPVPPRREAA